MSIVNKESEIDQLIFEGKKIGAIILIRKERSCGLADAIEYLSARYAELRSISPDRFLSSHEDYWTGFYS